MGKFEVEIKEKKGTCESPVFEKMVKNGDITATKVTEMINQQVQITGFALCTITTDEKTFDLAYVDTYEYGLISSGSEIFFNSVKTYFEDVKKFVLSEIKTKKGKTYKAVPLLQNKEEKTENKQESTDELPF